MNHEYLAEEWRNVDICTTNNKIECVDCYYTLTSKLLVGPAITKLIVGKRKGKKDNVIIDKTGQVDLRVWGKEQISNKSTYKISHLKSQKFQGEKYVAISLISYINPDEEIDISVREVFLTNKFIVHVKGINKGGNIHRYNYCPT